MREKNSVLIDKVCSYLESIVKRCDIALRMTNGKSVSNQFTLNDVWLFVQEELKSVILIHISFQSTLQIETAYPSINEILKSKKTTRNKLRKLFTLDDQVDTPQNEYFNLDKDEKAVSDFDLVHKSSIRADLDHVPIVAGPAIRFMDTVEQEFPALKNSDQVFMKYIEELFRQYYIPHIESTFTREINFLNEVDAFQLNTKTERPEFKVNSF